MTLKELLNKAQGGRTQNAFALQSDVATSMITQIKNGKRKPSPLTLQKLASKAHNGVTYEQLMIAAGYLSFDKENIKSEDPQLNRAFELLSKLDAGGLSVTIGFMQGLLSMSEEMNKKRG